MNATNLKLNGFSGAICQRGFTLVELMIAMTIGLFLSAGVIALFLGTKQSYRSNGGMSLIQENGRFAIEYLGRNIREAGFRDFSTATNPVTIPEPIKGWNGASSDPSSELAGYSANYIPETDFFRIQYGDASQTVNQDLYYVGRSSTGEPGLRENAQELLKGVYDMQVLYGLDNDNDYYPDEYVTADSVEDTEWPQVVAIRLDLLLGSSEDNLVDTSMSLPYENNDGSFFTATDRRIYQNFSTTIALRNRLP